MLLVPSLRGLARLPLLVCLALTAVTAAVFGQTPSAADGFDPNVDGNVYAMVAQGNGQIIIAGQFQNLQPNGGLEIPRHNIARVNPDGSLDTSFDPNADGPVRAVVVQPDGKIIIGGDFTHVGGVARDGLARLNPDGSVDSSFAPGVGTSSTLPTTPQVFALALQLDGSVVVGGSFGSAHSTGGSPVIRNNIARFDDKGILDLTYDPNANGTVLALALHVDGKIVVGGGFTQFQSPEPTTRMYVARLNPDGTVDSQFDPKANNGVTSIAIQRDGKILLGGFFTTLQPLGNTSPANLSHLARLNPDGTLDSEFYPIVGGNVYGLAVGPDGAIYVGGNFTQVWGRGNVSASRGYVARFNADGTIDQTFNPGVNEEVDAFAFQPDGKVIIGGYFTRAQPAGLNTQIIRNRIARVLTTGELDTAFQLDPGGRILASVVQSDGKIVVGGSFTNIGGMTRNYIARLNPDGTVDPSYNPNLNGRVYTMAYQNANGENKVLIGGSFTTVGSDTRNHIARLNPADGSVDSEFNPNIDGAVGSIVVQSDGNILVGGSFGNAQPIGVTSPVARANLLRLTPAGQVDPNFDPTPNAAVSAIAVQSDGKILIGGNFTALQPGATGNVHYRNYIARLNTDGTVDSSYKPDPNYSVTAIVEQSDGKAVVGGSFTGFYTSGLGRQFLARINADGTIDTSFDPHPNNIVLTLGLQSDGSILVGGAFTTFQPAGDTDWTLRKYFGRLTPAGKVDPTLNLDLNEVPGNRVDSITVLKDDTFLIGGTFTSLQPVGSSSRVARNHFAELTKAGALVDTFDPGAGGFATSQIKAITLQPDGRVLVGGDFSDLGGAHSTNVARFSPEGTPDASFNAALATDGPVNAIAVRATGPVAKTQLGGFAWFNSDGTLRTSFQPSGIDIQGQFNSAVFQSDGKLILAGAFTDLSNTVQGNIIRLLPGGAVDTGYQPQVNGTISAMALQSDGKLIIVGSFTTVDSTARNYIARLNTDGTLDTSFDPNANGTVTSVLIQSDGSIVFGGYFTTLTPNGATAATTRNYIARVDNTGNVDTKFDPNLNAGVNAMALQSDGHIIVGGNFTTAAPNGATSTSMAPYLARINSDGTLDNSFIPNPNGGVSSVLVQPDGKVVFGGSFSQVQQYVNGNYVAITTRDGVARVNSDGSVDASFDPNLNSTASTLALDPADGSILIGGNFTALKPNGSTAAIARNHLARVKSDGSLDPAFNPDIAGTISMAVVAPDRSVLIGGTFTNLQANGAILIGGSFNSVGGLPQKNLAELNDDGSVNAEFAPDANGAVNAVLPLPDGRFVVGGTFTTIGGVSAPGLARFTASGAIDTTFTAPPASLTGGVSALALQPDGRLVVGTAGANGVIRLNSDGSLDGTFKAGAPFAPAVAIAIQADGRILVAGPGGGVASRLLRLNADGSVDSSFTAPSGATGIDAIALQADGSIIIGGSFSNLGGAGISNLARLTAAGGVDTSFNPSANGAVSALALQSDGHLMMGGTFTTVGGLQRVSLARVANTSPATEVIGVSADAKTVTWVRRGTAGEVAGVTFEQSPDGQSWTLLGNGTRVGTTSDWQLTGLTTLPTSGPFFIRARGIVPTGGQSAGAYETVSEADLTSPVAGLTSTVAPVVTSTAWDQTHLVWTVDPASGVIRITDALSGVVFDPASTVLLGGSHPTAASSARLADLSTRGDVTASTPLINGFVVSGTNARTVLVRAIGPGLAPFGVTNYLKTPRLVLVNNSTGQEIAHNNGWNSDPNLSRIFAQTGAFPLTPGSADCALVATLYPGSYTVQVQDADSTDTTGGNALVEVYDAGDMTDGTSRIINLSSRGTVAPNGTLIGGLVISGNAPKTLLVRAAGPALTKYGVSNVLADPEVSVYDSQGNVVATNDNWEVDSNVGATSSINYGAAISSAAASVGAFSFDAGSKDAALVITLPAGAYTIQAKGVGGTSGAALIEVYELP